MPAITFPSGDETLREIDKILVEKNRAEPRRKYIGASSLGDSCSRKLWYRLYTDHVEQFDADTLRRFNDGHRSEDVMAEHLRMVPGIELWTHDKSGNQYGFEDFSLGDKTLSGHYDGVILGILEAPLTPHVWECKSVNEKSFTALKKLKDEDEKTALKKWNMTYFAQAIIYMHYTQLTRHYLTVCTPGMRDYTSIRTNNDPEFARALQEKAKRIINAKEPPERIGSEDYYECKWCSFHSICHNKRSG